MKRSGLTSACIHDRSGRAAGAQKATAKEAKLSYNGNLLIENRNGLIVTTELFQANGTAERDAALVMLEKIPGEQRITVGADKAYDTKDLVEECRNLKVTPQVAQNTKRRQRDRRTDHAARRIRYQPSETEAN